MTPNTRELKKIGKWITGWDTGLSSEFMCGVFLGGEPERISVPIDPSDFGRCYRFLENIDKSRRLTFILYLGQKYPEWKVINDNWFELEKLWKEERNSNTAPKLYKFMKDLGL